MRTPPLFVAVILAAGALLAPPAPSPADGDFDIVLAGGRVIDPESGLDAVRHVGIRAGSIAAVSEAPLPGRTIVDVGGLVVAPGFIDLHAHGQENRSNSFQARDGVTTALDLEAGSQPVSYLYDAREGNALLHYGVSAGHLPARVYALTGISPGHYLSRAAYATWYERWLGAVVIWFLDPMASLRRAASDAEIAEVVATVARGLDEGGVGIGFGLDYAPGASDAEVRALFALAAARGVPCFVHMKGVASPTDMSAMESILAHAEATGAALHIHHVTSSGQARTPRYLTAIETARARGLDVTVEAYPYTAGSTYIESAFFDDGWRERLGIDYGDLQWSATGERLTEESFRRHRAQGGPVIIHMIAPEIVDAAIAHPLVMIASDGIPMLAGGEHPRGAGTFARVLGRYARELRALSWTDAIRKMTLMPAARLERCVPAMRRKGRIRVGADADITVFDPATVVDRATFEDPYQASAGVRHVLVGGTFVVRDGALVENVHPGQPIRAGSASTGPDPRDSRPPR